MERKGARKKLRTVFWLIRMRRIEILHNIVPNLREIYIFGKKITFSSKTQAHLAS